MIRTPTVFVLGAGASVPYGFPSGPKLARDICARLDDPHTLRALGSLGISVNEAQTFVAEFQRSGRESVDAFLQSRTEFLDVAKLAIALEVGSHENTGTLLGSDKPDDWMKYLFNKLLGGSLQEFTENQLKVITFNFDRSFERRLIDVVEVNYKLSREAAYSACAKTVPILHVHGDLGGAAWSHIEDESSREYTPLTINASPTELRLVAERIKIIHEEIRKPVVDTARQWLMRAEHVCFIGFGYHRLNMKRLLVKDLPSNTKKIAGTFLGMERGEIDAVVRETNGKMEEYVTDALTFLRKSSFVHE